MTTRTMVFAVAALVALGHDADAAPITINGSPEYLASVASCEDSSGALYINCTSTTHLNDVSLTGTDAEFKKSFDAWNAQNAADKKWTLADGGLIPKLELTVTVFETTANEAHGGLKIQIDWAAGADVMKSDYMWSQGLFDNYFLDGTSGEPFYEMDVIDAPSCNNADMEKICPPLYPAQYGDRRFVDRPTAAWPQPNAFFEARAFLSKANYEARTLTIYEGVNYGFKLNAQPIPEPATVLLTLSGLLGIRAVRRRYPTR